MLKLCKVTSKGDISSAGISFSFSPILTHSNLFSSNRIDECIDSAGGVLAPDLTFPMHYDITSQLR